MISEDSVDGLHPWATARTSRRRLIALGMVGAVTATVLQPSRARAASVETAVVDLQNDWEVITHQTPNSERERRYEALAAMAHQISKTYVGRSEALIWEGIVTASWAAEKGGLGALSLVKKARAMYESAIRIDDHALDGSAYTSLAVLYERAPLWPLSFGDNSKAHELL